MFLLQLQVKLLGLQTRLMSRFEHTECANIVHAIPAFGSNVLPDSRWSAEQEAWQGWIWRWRWKFVRWQIGLPRDKLRMRPAARGGAALLCDSTCGCSSPTCTCLSKPAWCCCKTTFTLSQREPTSTASWCRIKLDAWIVLVRDAIPYQNVSFLKDCEKCINLRRNKFNKIVRKSVRKIYPKILKISLFMCDNSYLKRPFNVHLCCQEPPRTIQNLLHNSF